MGNMFAGDNLNKIIKGGFNSIILPLKICIFFVSDFMQIGCYMNIQQLLHKSDNRNFFTCSWLNGVVEL